jgi:hypothetical protein
MRAATWLTVIDEQRDAEISRAMLSVKRRLYRAYDEAIAEALNGARLPKRWPTVDDLIARRQQPEPTAEWSVQSGSVNVADVPWATLPGDGIPVLAEAYRRTAGWTPRPEDFAPAPDENMPGRYRLTPRSEVQAGPRSRPGRWVDEQLQRPGRWWRRKKAATNKRMGITDEQED